MQASKDYISLHIFYRNLIRVFTVIQCILQYPLIQLAGKEGLNQTAQMQVSF